MVRADKRTVERLAIALWNIARREMQGETGPSFYEYADGDQEPMPFHKQDDDFKQFWRQRARRVLRTLGRK